MFYLVKIGSMKGNVFYELTSRSVSSGEQLPDVKSCFEKKYEGLEVKGSRIDAVPETIAVGKHPFLENIWVRHTPEETALYEKWKERENEALGLLCEQHSKIRERYAKLNYTAITIRRDIALDTSHEGTLIRYLPIDGSAFLGAVGSGEEI